MNIYDPYKNNDYREYFHNSQPSSEFPKVTPTFFNHWYNKFYTKTHTPHHHGYDIITKQNAPVTVSGKFHYGDPRKDLEDEWVSIFTFDSSDNPKWKYVTRKKTDADGMIYHTFPKHYFNSPDTLIRFLVEGDGTYADMHVQLIDPNTKYVVFDVDGTLTASDTELLMENLLDLLQIDYNQKHHASAPELVNYYASNGYNIIYLTARPSWLSSITSQWLKANDFPYGILHTNSAAVPVSQSDYYKEAYLKKLKKLGAKIKYVYGNASTDITAYKGAGIPSNKIFIIGKNAGKKGTTPINNYTKHLEDIKKNSR